MTLTVDVFTSETRYLSDFSQSSPPSPNLRILSYEGFSSACSRFDIAYDFE